MIADGANTTQSTQRFPRARLGAVLPCQWTGATSQGGAESVPEKCLHTERQVGGRATRLMSVDASVRDKSFASFKVAPSQLR